MIMSLIKQDLHNKMTDYLAEREQLMHDIECIVESHIFSQWGSEYGDVSDELIRTLCDAVCKNFPTK